MKLTQIPLSDLEAEIKRRKEEESKTVRFEVQGVEFNLTLQEVKELQQILNKINPPKDPFEIWRKAQEEAERRRDNIYIQPPINVPNWPNYPVAPKDEPFYNPIRIWCQSKLEAPLWNGSATS